MLVTFLLVVVLPALLVAAAVCDLMSYTIPNVITGAMILLFVVFIGIMAWSGETLNWNEIGLHLLAGALGLAVGIGLFALGWVGGGDAKLFAAALLWLGWHALFDYVITASIGGGLFTLLLLMLRRMPLPVFLVKQAWIARLADPKGAVPYGVALASAALLVLPDTQIFELASRG